MTTTKTQPAQRVRRLVLVGSNGVATARKDGFPFGIQAEEHEDVVIAAELNDRIGLTGFAGAPNSARGRVPSGMIGADGPRVSS